jgi:lipoprotein-releasing system permease protein
MRKPQFLGFFVKYIFKAKTRQGLLLMAMAGLMLSSFSLLVVQSTLQGLQNNRMNRNKSIKGHYTVTLKSQVSRVEQLQTWLKNSGVKFSRELEIEGLLRRGGHVAPVILHGISSKDYIPKFLPRKIRRSEILLSPYLSDKIHSDIEDEIQFISPSHTDSFFGDLPRYKTVSIKRFTDSKEPDVDEYHAWVDLRVTQSILRKREINRIRIFSPLSDEQIAEIAKTNVEIKSWEELNSTLVYALALENNMTLFLFMTTVLLVVLTIASGLSIFYARIKQDFASFWILGMSLNQIKKTAATNISLITLSSLVLGNVMALFFLFLLKKYSPAIMPEMFVDRSLPIKITFFSFVFSLIIPSIVTLIFSYISNMRFFGKKDDFLQLIRSVGR